MPNRLGLELVGNIIVIKNALRVGRYRKQVVRIDQEIFIELLSVVLLHYLVPHIGICEARYES
jgi:hypothetical protein